MSHTKSCMSIDEFDVSCLKGVAIDSRQVQEGYLFAALSGERHDGRDYIDQAITSGASAVLVEEGFQPKSDGNVIYIADQNPRKALSYILSIYYKDQPEHNVAVTGTNGKSSVVHFLRQIWQSLGHKAVSMGTLGLSGDTNVKMEGSITTPDPVSLHRVLQELKGEGVDYLAMEASSHGLDQYRLDGVNVSVAAFTSFSQDHLDYHKSEQDYLASKARLFSKDIMQEGVAVLNADILEYDELVEISKASGHRVLSYGFEGEECKICKVEPLMNGQDVELEVFGEKYKTHLPLIGEFQVMNVCCALLSALALEESVRAKVMKALPELKAVAGRMEPVAHNAYVDYAHTPDALEVALKALRPHVRGKIFCIFGCGGDRDQSKRSLMGKAAYAHADVVIITDDNPRSEDPETIRNQIRSGMPEEAQNIHLIGGRRAAIDYAVSKAGEGDIILLAGKGHEQQQIFKDHIENFNDVEELKKAITRVGTF
ncbi:MAG: UDP-N-acetylmuramoyl-L-alanyl-D-glutamate--2,6-diaminopimelate ligase [Alphaproteobacteria bacterium]|nr:UDP-N-acetylmuramoyl-L-alanyl-D-glutamate--2,6-diaminopimelate ligase [Alphaproteobacteria bacterium]